MKAPTPFDRTVFVVAVILGLVALAFAFAGCSGRDQAVSDSAATIWEAADATEKGASASDTMPAIKANAAAIIKASGNTYEPAGVKP